MKKEKYLIALNILFFVYSFTGVLTKAAAREEFFSMPFFLLYGGVIALMGFYAVAWQQIIRYLPLTVAYANKAMIIIWGLLWGVLFFNERVTVGKLVGVFMVFMGIVLFSRSNDEETQ